MLHRTFWTQRRLTGIILLLGCVLFLTAAGLTPTDEKGTFIYDLPFREQLGVIFHRWTTWHWGLMLFCIAVVLTLLGFALLTKALQDAGDRMLSQMGLIALVLAAGLFLIPMTFRLSIEYWAAQETVRTNVIPPIYLQLFPWVNAFYGIYTSLTFFAALAYGAALIVTRILPRWLGWGTIVYNLVLLYFFIQAGEMPPFVHYLLPIVIGALLLLPRYQHTGKINREEKLSLASSLVAEKHEVR